MNKLEDIHRWTTEIEELRKQLAETQNKLNLFESAVKYAYTPIVITDGELDLPGPTIVYVNSAFTEMTGYSEKDITGKTPRILQGPKTDRSMLDRLRYELSKGHSFHGETINYRKDGSAYIVEWLIAPIKNEDGEIIHFISCQQDVTQLRRSQEALQKAHDELEIRVEERTQELVKVNKQLNKQIKDKQNLLNDLRKRERDLKEQAQHLNELNSALKVLLQQREIDRLELEQNVLTNVKKTIMPFIEKLKKSELDKNQKNYLNTLEYSLKEIISPFITTLSSEFLSLTPMEIQVAHLIREGKTTKEIAELLNLSEHTIITHRSNVRRKLGLKKEKINLTTYLKSLI